MNNYRIVYQKKQFHFVNVEASSQEEAIDKFSSLKKKLNGSDWQIYAFSLLENEDDDGLEK